MWLLVIVLLATPAGISRMTVLNSFEKYEDCMPERDRIGFAMAESYPQENTFRIECKQKELPPSLQPIRFEREALRPFTLVTDSLQAPSSQFSLSHQLD